MHTHCIDTFFPSSTSKLRVEELNYIFRASIQLPSDFLQHSNISLPDVIDAIRCTYSTIQIVVRVAHWKFTTALFWFGCACFFLLSVLFIRVVDLLEIRMLSMENCTELLTSMHNSIVICVPGVTFTAWCCCCFPKYSIRIYLQNSRIITFQLLISCHGNEMNLYLLPISCLLVCLPVICITFTYTECKHAPKSSCRPHSNATGCITQEQQQQWQQQ